MTKEEYKQVCQWIADGVCQTKDSNQCKVFHDFDPEIESPEIWHNFSLYRQKPEPKLRPWKPEEVPVGAIVKHDDGITVWRHLIVGIDHYSNDLRVNSCGLGLNDILYSKYTHSTDGGKTWQPCGVQE